MEPPAFEDVPKLGLKPDAVEDVDVGRLGLKPPVAAVLFSEPSVPSVADVACWAVDVLENRLNGFAGGLAFGVVLGRAGTLALGVVGSPLLRAFLKGDSS